jgi:hypothetical protein
MSTIFFDPPFADDERRRRLFEGSVVVLSPRAETRALIEHARAMVEQAFAPHDPLAIHRAIPVERCVDILAELKPRFIHHPRSKQLIRDLLGSLDCDSEETYFDVPRLRTAMPKDYLATGIAYAFHPHRDTWYSAPAAQLNWWLPLYDLSPENCLAFHPAYFDRPLANSSRTYNYYRWNAESRPNAAKHVGKDTRVQPVPEEPVARASEFRPICPPGAIILFSGAQLHETVPNTTETARYSIDFRTVSAADLRAGRGAPNVDSECTGTTLRDYLRVSDLEHLPDALIAEYDDGVPPDGVPVYPAPSPTPVLKRTA